MIVRPDVIGVGAVMPVAKSVRSHFSLTQLFWDRGANRVQRYLCLLFDNANHVRLIEKIDADGDQDAMTEALRLMQALPNMIGFELWKDGRKIANHFEPQ